jgi:hypothetical protein
MACLDPTSWIPAACRRASPASFRHCCLLFKTPLIEDLFNANIMVLFASSELTGTQLISAKTPAQLGPICGIVTTPPDDGRQVDDRGPDRCSGRVKGDGSPARFGQYCAMGVRTRGLDMAIAAKQQVADAAARAEAKAVIERWNEQLATSRDMLWSPTIRAALIAGTPWLDVFCPGCGTSRAIDLRKVDRRPLASVATHRAGIAVVVPGIGP